MDVIKLFRVICVVTLVLFVQGVKAEGLSKSGITGIALTCFLILSIIVSVIISCIKRRTYKHRVLNEVEFPDLNRSLVSSRRTSYRLSDRMRPLALSSPTSHVLSVEIVENTMCFMSFNVSPRSTNVHNYQRPGSIRRTSHSTADPPTRLDSNDMDLGLPPGYSESTEPSGVHRVMPCFQRPALELTVVRKPPSYSESCEEKETLTQASPPAYEEVEQILQRDSPDSTEAH